MHPPDRLLQALVDGELPADGAANVQTHASSCDRCAARIAAIRALGASFHAAVDAIDAAAPPDWDEDAQNWDARGLLVQEPGRLHVVVGGARPAISPGGAATGPPARRARFRMPLRWAALFVLGTVAAGAAALLVRRAVSTARDVVPVAVEEAATPATGAAPVAGSVGVQPENGRVTVSISGGGAGSALHIELTDGPGIIVRVEGEATARFRARDGSVDVALDDRRAAVRIRMPASIVQAVIRADGRVLAQVREGRIDPPEAAAGLPIR